jgi:site-specific recombinase XerD
MILTLIEGYPKKDTAMLTTLSTTPQTQLVISGQPRQRVTYDQLEPFIKAVCDSVRSDHSKRAYKRALKSFFQWFLGNGEPELCKATVQTYIDQQRQAGLGPVTINQRLAAVRNLVKEATDNGVIDATLAAGILRIRGEKNEGKRLGNWLNKSQAQTLLNSPDVTTLKGLRDQALLAVLIGCGLRRAEAASLLFSHIQQREGRWIIVDLVGKRSKTRSVPVPSWCKAAIDAWATAAGISEGHVYQSVNKGGHLSGDSMTAQSIYEAVKLYADRLGVPGLAAHDLRRTFAKLARKGGADLKQIQLTLGHASVKTTEIYLGEEQSLTDAPCDRLGLSLAAD